MKKNKFLMRRVMVYLLLIVLVLTVFDFIPLKFAKKDTDQIIDGQKYVFCYMPKIIIGPDIVNWVALGYDNNKINGSVPLIQILIKGKNPYSNFANRDFEPIKLFNGSSRFDSNKFILRGDIKNIPGKYDYEKIIEMTVKSWDIMYPISRLSIRGYYVPKSYLTIYDFDWLVVVKNWFVK